MIRTRQEWLAYISKRGTSGDQVYDILSDWKEDQQSRIAERERCAKIAAETDCEKAPDDYRITAPGLEGLCGDHERQQCFHGDRIAQLIREGATP